MNRSPDLWRHLQYGHAWRDVGHVAAHDDMQSSVSMTSKFGPAVHNYFTYSVGLPFARDACGVHMTTVQTHSDDINISVGDVKNVIFGDIYKSRWCHQYTVVSEISSILLSATSLMSLSATSAMSLFPCHQYQCSQRQLCQCRRRQRWKCRRRHHYQCRRRHHCQFRRRLIWYRVILPLSVNFFVLKWCSVYNYLFLQTYTSLILIAFVNQDKNYGSHGVYYLLFWAVHNNYKKTLLLECYQML